MKYESESVNLIRACPSCGATAEDPANLDCQTCHPLTDAELRLWYFGILPDGRTVRQAREKDIPE